MLRSGLAWGGRGNFDEQTSNTHGLVVAIANQCVAGGSAGWVHWWVFGALVFCVGGCSLSVGSAESAANAKLIVDRG